MRSADHERAASAAPVQSLPGRARGGRGRRWALALAVEPFAGVANVYLVFLTAVIGVAVRYGLGPSLFGSLLSVLACNFFFLPPLYTLVIAEPANIVTLGLFFLVALATSNLAARARDEALAARQRAETTEALYDFSRRIAGTVALPELLDGVVRQIETMLPLRASLLLPDGRGGYEMPAGIGGPCPRSRVSSRARCGPPIRPTRSRRHGRSSLRLGDRFFLPLLTTHGVIGLAALLPTHGAPFLGRDDQRLLEALLDQAALAIERMRLAEHRDRAQLAIETERLRSAILASLSHDLKTPAGLDPGRHHGAAQRPGPVRCGGARGACGDRAGRGRAHDPFRRQPARHDPARSGRHRCSTASPSNSARSSAPRCGGSGERLGIPGWSWISPAICRCSTSTWFCSSRCWSTCSTMPPNTPRPARLSRIEGRWRGDEIVLAVADEGPGIAAADLPHLFEKFYRAEKGDRRRAGTGLGLAICRGFVQALGGTIEAANRPAQPGAVFTVAFPLKIATATAASDEDELMSAPGVPILVVDDDPSIRRLLRTSLGAQGYRISEAASASAALDRLANETAELVLLDLGLPDLDGLDLIRTLRDAGNRLPIVVLSSRGDERGKVAALELGADDYVTKPFSMAELVARIRTALRHRLQAQGAEPVFRSGDLTVDLTRRLVSARGQDVKLSNKEWEILRLLVVNAGRVMTHRALMEAGLEPQGGCAISAHLRSPVAPEDRGRSRTPRPYPDRNRGGLSARHRRSRNERSGSRCPPQASHKLAPARSAGRRA